MITDKNPDYFKQKKNNQPFNFTGYFVGTGWTIDFVGAGGKWFQRRKAFENQINNDVEKTVWTCRRQILTEQGVDKPYCRTTLELLITNDDDDDDVKDDEKKLF